MTDMPYQRRWDVARLFDAELLKTHTSSERVKWRPYKELFSDRCPALLWAKDANENVFRVFYFSKSPWFYLADELAIAPKFDFFAIIED